MIYLTLFTYIHEIPNINYISLLFYVNVYFFFINLNVYVLYMHC